MIGGVFQTGVNLMRDLLEHGVPAVGVDPVRTHEGFRSIYGKSYLCPDPDERPGEWLEFMLALAKRIGGRPVFIASSDMFVSALGRHADALSQAYRFSAGARIQAALTSKEEQSVLADRYDFPRPLTCYVEKRADLEAFNARALFPALIKPLSHREWGSLPEGNPLRGRKVMAAATPEELLAHYALCEPYRPRVVAQEMIEGPDHAKSCYLGVYASDGGLLGSCVVKELRSHPMFYGGASIVRPVVDEALQAQCDRFLRDMRYSGIAEIEVKRDVRDGRAKLIEVNPRYSGTGDCPKYMGVETGWLHYQDLIGRNPAPVSPTRFDFHHVALKLDCMAIPGNLAAGELTWRELARQYTGNMKYFDLDLRDWRVAAGHLASCSRYLIGGVIRGLRGRA